MLQPQMPPHAYKTYQVTAPPDTHFRPATCEEVGCLAYQNGWRSVFDERTEQGFAQAYYVRKQSGRRFDEDRNSNGMTVFDFHPGQTCFRSSYHRVRIDRPELYVVTGGDWRGNPRRVEPYVHRRAADWLEDFGEHQDALATRLARG